MKKLILVALIALQGCAVTNLLPKPHDPAEAAKFTDIKQGLEKVDCDKQKDPQWQKLVDDARWLELYTTWRNDPQQKAVSEFYIAIQKARDGSSAYCAATIKLNTTRIQVIESAWRGR